MSAPGRLTISLDTEIAWGRIAAPELAEFRDQFARTREVIDRLLDMFERYDAPVTWALVGRLVEIEPATVHQAQGLLGRYFNNKVDESCYQDPVLNSEGNSFLRYPEVVDKIRNSSVSHELASHSYNHCFFTELQDPDLASLDCQLMNEVCKRHGFSVQSLVFPKNLVAYLPVLAQHGIRVYRSPDASWFDGFSPALQKVLRQLDYILPTRAPTVHPSIDEHGLLALPGSLLFRREHRSWRRHLPVSLLRMKAIRGLRHAARNGGTVHLWFHPFNFGHRMEEHLAELERVMMVAHALRSKGELQIATMGDHLESPGRINPRVTEQD